MVPPGAQRGSLLIRLYRTNGSRQIRGTSQVFLEHLAWGERWTKAEPRPRNAEGNPHSALDLASWATLMVMRRL